MKKLISLIFCLFATACHQGVETTNEVQEKVVCIDGKFHPVNSQGIIGGEVVSAESWLAKTAVFVVQRRGNEQYMCTGVLIDQDIVLTAAHCVVREPRSGTILLPSPSAITVAFSPQPECDEKSGKITSLQSTAVQFEIHDEYRQTAQTSLTLRPQTGDLALIKLSQPAPSDYRSSKLTSVFRDPRLQSTLVAGYGRTIGAKANENSARILRATTVRGITQSEADKIANELFLAASKEPKLASEMPRISVPTITSQILTASANSPRIPLINSPSGVCSGDSGGASFVLNAQNRYVVTGVAATVVNFFGSDPCHFISHFTNVFYYRSWIESTFRKLRSPYSIRTTPFEQ